MVPSRFFAILLVVLLAQPARGAELAGTVVRLQGAAIATNGGDIRPLRPGSAIFVGDKVSTAAETRLEMSMVDDGFITLGDHSFFQIHAYAEEAQSGNGALELIRGVFVAVSGLLAKGRDDNLIIATPFATIGIRGTTVWGGQRTGRLEVLMLDGRGVFVDTPAGRVELTAPGIGTSVDAPGAAPGAPQAWSGERIEAAMRTVSFQ